MILLKQSCSHSLIQHACKISMWLFSCLGFMLIAFNVFLFIAPSGPRGIQSRRSSNGSLAWRETSSGRQLLLFSLKTQLSHANYSICYIVSYHISGVRNQMCRQVQPLNSGKLSVSLHHAAVKRFTSSNQFLIKLTGITLWQK